MFDIEELRRLTDIARLRRDKLRVENDIQFIKNHEKENVILLNELEKQINQAVGEGNYTTKFQISAFAEDERRIISSNLIKYLKLKGFTACHSKWYFELSISWGVVPVIGEEIRYGGNDGMTYSRVDEVYATRIDCRIEPVVTGERRK